MASATFSTRACDGARFVSRGNSTAASAAELVPHFRTVLTRCQLRQGEVVLLHTDTRADPEYAAAALAAALSLDASPYQVTVPTRHPNVEQLETIARAWEEADLVIDLVSTGAHLFSPLNTRAVMAGTRVLRVSEPADVLDRMFPSDDVRRRTRLYADRLTAGQTLTVTSDSGTMIEMQIGGRAGVAQYGLADEEGRWDHWPSGLAQISPIEDTVDGRLVVGTGDLVFTLGRYVRDPIECTVNRGVLTVGGAGADAMILREWLAAQDVPQASVVGVVGWGTDFRARWDRVAWRLHEPAGTMDAESFAGNVRTGLGNNASSMLRGSNVCRSHIDLQLRSCTVAIDGETVVDAGRLVDLPGPASKTIDRKEQDA